jgi:hypothetical protein
MLSFAPSSEADRRKRAIFRLSLAAIAALWIPFLLSTDFLSGGDDGLREERTEVDYYDMEEALAHRSLTTGSGEPAALDEDYYRDLPIPAMLQGEDDVATAAILSDAEEDPAGIAWLLKEEEEEDNAAATLEEEEVLPPYTMEEALETTKMFANVLAVVIYDPESDLFEFHYPTHMPFSSGCRKLVGVFKNSFTEMLRGSFPERFQGKESDEMVLLVSSGDVVHLQEELCFTDFPHATEQCPGSDIPILQFGSVFKSKEILRNLMAMPMPTGSSVHCFKMWAHQIGKGQDPQVCSALQPGYTMVYGEETQEEWDGLVPQVVWRGSDYGFLNHFMKSIHRPFFKADLLDTVDAMEEGEKIDKKEAGLRAMVERYNLFWPRWQSIILSAEAEVEAKEKGTLPWINSRFTGYGNIPQKYVEYAQFEEHGLPAMGDRMDREQLAGYRYHIDLGGGGGTTWTGTQQKLAMPGLLFHHETPTKDFINDFMRPWVHYVPIAPDLRDLREKFEWAESHPRAAKAIANRGSELMRWMGTDEGFERVFDTVFRDQVRRTMDAYKPLRETHPEGKSWKKVLEEYHGTAPYYTCTGNGERDSCKSLRE